jgi:hypothetical protein
MEKQELYKKYMPYVKWGIVAAVAVVLMFVYEQPFTKEGAKEIAGAISDCFAIPGILMAGVGALTYLAKLGAYDGISYAFSNFALHSLIPGMHEDKHESFYEYKTAKDEKGRKWLSQLFFVGLVPLSISVIILIVYAFL